MSNSLPDNIIKERRHQQQHQSIKTISQAESIVSSQVFDKRRTEIYEYLKLFGYKPDKTIIQVHITGFFRKKGQASTHNSLASINVKSPLSSSEYISKPLIFYYLMKIRQSSFD